MEWNDIREGLREVYPNDRRVQCPVRISVSILRFYSPILICEWNYQPFRLSKL
jgi:hypothetical protein